MGLSRQLLLAVCILNTVWGYLIHAVAIPLLRHLTRAPISVLRFFSDLRCVLSTHGVRRGAHLPLDVNRCVSHAKCGGGGGRVVAAAPAAAAAAAKGGPPAEDDPLGGVTPSCTTLREATECVTVLTRCPVPGRTKTRLIPSLGPVLAAELHAELASHAVAVAHSAHLVRGSSAVVHYHHDGDGEGSDAAVEARLRRTLGVPREIPLVRQGPRGTGLGSRMFRALDDFLWPVEPEEDNQGEEAGCGRAPLPPPPPSSSSSLVRKCVLIGSDCPLSPAHIDAAMRALDTRDVVFGPAADGGFYLVGARSTASRIAVRCCFEDTIPWGTGTVLADCTARCLTAGLRFSLLPVLSDVDEADDVPAWRALVASDRVPHMRTVSVVVPARNEAGSIARVVSRAKSAAFDPSRVEVIVCDGGSIDTTRAAAAKAGARVVFGEVHTGRARQQNLGASEARGSILLFLHADTELPPHYDAAVRAALADPSVSVASFSLSIAGGDGSTSLIADLANFRATRSMLPYGDQGIAMTRETFDRLGGFEDVPLMEDFLLVERARAAGAVVVLGHEVVTSDRRWKAMGVWRTTMLNLFIVHAFRLGLFSVDTLHRIYYRGANMYLGGGGSKGTPTKAAAASKAKQG